MWLWPGKKMWLIKGWGYGVVAVGSWLSCEGTVVRLRSCSRTVVELG